MTVDQTRPARSLDVRSAGQRDQRDESVLAERAAPLRVLHVIPNLGGGGSERFVLTLLPLLDRDVCDPKLCVLGSPPYLKAN